jgi:hypothetical protein
VILFSNKGHETRDMNRLDTLLKSSPRHTSSTTVTCRSGTHAPPTKQWRSNVLARKQQWRRKFTNHPFLKPFKSLARNTQTAQRAQNDDACTGPVTQPLNAPGSPCTGRNVSYIERSALLCGVHRVQARGAAFFTAPGSGSAE